MLLLLLCSLTGLELCNVYGVDGEGIAACWISFANNNGYDSLTLEGLDHFEREELTKSKKMGIKKIDNFQMYDASTIDEVYPLALKLIVMY